MYLSIMKPEVLPEVAQLGRGLWVVEGPDGPALVVKAGKELILAARERRELRLYLAPYQSGDVTGLTLLTACFDDPSSPLTITTPLMGSDPLTQAFQSFPDEFSVCFFDEHNRELLSCSAQARLNELRKHAGFICPLEGELPSAGERLSLDEAHYLHLRGDVVFRVASRPIIAPTNDL